MTKSNDPFLERTESEKAPVLDEGMIRSWWRILIVTTRPARALTSHPVVTALASLVIFIIALKVINEELTKYTLQDLQNAIDDIGLWTVAGAFVSVTICYGALTFNDRYALSMLGKRLPHARTARASVVAYALANTLGFSWATAGPARQRLYRKWGLLRGEVGALSFVTGTAVQIGGLAAAGLGLFIGAPEVALHGPLGPLFWYGVGVLTFIPAGFWMAYAKYGPLKADVAGADLRRPKPPQALAHLLVIVLNWACAAGILYILLPNHGGWSFPAFLAVYVLAGMLGALSGAPGGLGVFEAVILTLAPVSQDAPGAAIALIIYRLLYNVLPLGFATIILGLDHAVPAARPAARAAKRVGSQVGVQVSEATQAFGARIAAILVFVAGFGLLGAIATPSITGRLNALADMQLSVLAEAAHIVSGIIGSLLLFVAAGLWRRSKAAWSFGIVLLGLGIITCLFKGLDWEQALALAVIFAVLLSARDGFYAASLPKNKIIGPRWLALIVGALSTIAWVASFAYPDMDVQWQTWLDFSRDNDLARSLRAGIGVVVTCFMAFMLIAVLQAKKPLLKDDEDDY